jgi:hypothetical protein
MKRAFFLGMGLLVLPSVAEAQLQLGFDTGVQVQRQGGISQTNIEIPSRWLRIGIGGGRISFESRTTFAYARAEGESASVIRILPGINFAYRGSTYFRGEVGLLLFTASGETASQYAAGLAVGTKRQIGAGPLYLRLETGVVQWQGNNDFIKSTDFHGVVGISVVVN